MKKRGEQRWDWSHAREHMIGKIQPTDIDGAIERRGHFLFIETKHPDESMRDGQRRFLTELSKVCPEKITVVVVDGWQDWSDVEGDEPPVTYVYGFHNVRTGESKEGNVEDLGRHIGAWLQRVSDSG